MTEPTEPAPDLVESFRKRKLVQWAAAYGAAGWVTLQVLALIGQQFEWSPAWQRGFTIVIGLGFFVTLVLAWFHGERGAQRVTGAELALLLVLAAVGGGLFWRTVVTAPKTAPAATAEPSPATAPSSADSGAIPTIEKDPSIAVLPLINMSSDKEQEYFSDGISEELLNLLAKVPKLRVIARTSSFAFKGEKIDITDVARKLHVAAVLEGSVRKSGDKVRITVQLIRATDGTHLWSQTYDRALDDIFKVQDEIAAAVVAQLKISLLGALPSAKPVDPKAYPLILQGQFVLNQRTRESTEQARALYQQALALAPDEARAWDGLAMVHLTQANIGAAPNVESYRLAREAALKALAIDPNDALAHSLLGRTGGTPGSSLATIAGHFQRSVELNPTDSEVLANAGRFVARLNRLDEATALFRYVTIHDPANPVGYYNLGLARYFAGDWDGAIAAERVVLTLSPKYAVAHYTIGTSLIFKGDAEAALSEMQAEGEGWRVIGLPLAYHALGRKAEADAALAALIAGNAKEGASNIAYVYAFRGDADHAFEWLEQAVQNRDTGITTVVLEPFFRNLHKDPRWLPFLRKIGRAPEQLAAIEFKVTLPQ